MVSGQSDTGGVPRLPFGCSVGITGHRNDIGRDTMAAIEPALDRVFAQLHRAGNAIKARELEFFSAADNDYRLISPLADGTDQLAAHVALAQGYALEVILPFPAHDYAGDFDDPHDLASFHALLARASSRLELPGERAHVPEAYVHAGRAVVAHVDIIVAVWDGEAARGRGGTAEIVEHALRRHLPVVHVHTDPDKPTRILWTGYSDPPLDVLDACDVPERAFDPVQTELLFEQLFAPPRVPAERGFIRAFYAERERLTRPRVEYPLLLALLGVRRLRALKVRVAPYAQSVAEEWRAFHKGCAEAEQNVAGGFDALENAYSWADKLADHYAVAYRSGHVLNYVLAAVATVFALSALIFPEVRFYLETAELATILLFIWNTRVGTRGGWHRRWLDYRHLAEELRPMRYLKLFALARPKPLRRRGTRRWVDWYAAGLWRAMGCPSGTLDHRTIDMVSTLMVNEEVTPQIAYHQASSRRMHHVEHRLHRIANVLFVVTLTSLVLFLVGHTMLHETFARFAIPFALTAGLPALAAAMHGIREQGEFERTATRSSSTASALTKLAVDLGVRPIALTRAATLSEEAACVMLDDVGEWRMAYEMRDLALPA